MTNSPLTPEEEAVIVHKQTELPFSGKYNDFYKKGIYVCRRCGQKLFDSAAKFKSGCGWPSFDEVFPGSVKYSPDPDENRLEATCANCEAHLGHVFKGEQFTPKDTRYCVNSLSLKFIPEDE